MEEACILRDMDYGYKVWLVTVLWCVRYPLRETAKNYLAADLKFVATVATGGRVKFLSAV